MENDLSFQDAVSLLTYHLRAGSFEKGRISLYERTLQGPLKRLIARRLSGELSNPDIDALPISQIPHEVIREFMKPSHNLTYKTGRKLFKFLIHAGRLEPELLPSRKTVLITAIEQAPDELSDEMSLHQACCAFVKHLWQNKALLYGAIRTQYMQLQSFSKWSAVHKSLGAVSRDDIRNYLRYLQQERGYHAASRASALTLLRAFFGFFTARELLKTNPTTTLRVKKPKNALSRS